jgi:hypothetical protein
MNLAPLYKAYALFFNGAGCLLNLFLVGFFLYAYRRHRNQLAFPIFAFGCFCGSFVTAYLFAADLQRLYGIELLPFWIWRILAYVYFAAEPLVFISNLLGPIVLVRTYGQERIPSANAGANSR